MIAFSLCQFNVKHYNFVKFTCSSCIPYFCTLLIMYLYLSYYYIHTFLLTYIHDFWCNNVSAIQNFETIIYVSGPDDQPIHYFIKNHYSIGLHGYVFLLWSPLYSETQVEFGYWSEKVLSSKLSTSLVVEPCFWNWHHHLGKTEVVWRKLQNCTGTILSFA